jgi:hypothetical protein
MYVAAMSKRYLEEGGHIMSLINLNHRYLDAEEEIEEKT